MNVGFPVYPEGLRNEDADNFGPRTESGVRLKTVHYMGSERFSWLGRENVLAFADLWNGNQRVITIDLRHGLQNLIILSRSLDPRELLSGQCIREYAGDLEFVLSVDEISASQMGPDYLRVRFNTMVNPQCFRDAVTEIVVPGLRLKL